MTQGLLDNRAMRIGYTSDAALECLNKMQYAICIWFHAEVLNVFIIVIIEVLLNLSNCPFRHENPYVILGALPPVFAELTLADRAMAKVPQCLLKLMKPGLIAIDEYTIEVEEYRSYVATGS